jgi:hypothetical protein
VKRRLTNAVLVMLVLLCAILWARSYLDDDYIQYGWTPDGSDGQLIGVCCWSNRGQMGIGYISEPMAFANYVATMTTNSDNPMPGIHWRTTSTPFILNWRDLWFITGHIHLRIPAHPGNQSAVFPKNIATTQATGQSWLSQYIIGIPFWLPILLLGTPIAWQLLNLPARRRRARIAAGQCISCGYSLRATPNRCPECGTIPLQQ